MKKLLLFCSCLAMLAFPAGAIAQVSGQVTDGHFVRMFPNLQSFTYSDQASADLAAQMENPHPDAPGVNSGVAGEDSKTLAAWQTYFGQMLDHNLDFDATAQPSSPANVTKIANDSAGVFNLATIFGRGPILDPELYQGGIIAHLLHPLLKTECTLGTPAHTGVENVLAGNANGACDIARNANGTMLTPWGTNISEGVSRDDENQIVSQMQTAWVLFYNHFINQGMGFLKARDLTIAYYQEEIYTQMLPDFVTNTAYIGDYLTAPFSAAVPQTVTVNTPDDPTTQIPAEFSVGAYRFGHALVRNVYHINDSTPVVGDRTNNQVNVPIFDVNNFQTGDLSGGAPLEGPAQSQAGNCELSSQFTLLCQQPTSHQITWKAFFKTLNCGGASAQALAEAPWCTNPDGSVVPFDPVTSDSARQTQPNLSPNLFNLPGFVIPGCTDTASPVCNGSNQLVSRDLARGNYDGLPSGQAVAAQLGCPVIPASSINPTTDAVFNTGTPLIYYVLAEAQQSGTVLGCTGSKIISEVFLRALVAQNANQGNSFQLIAPDPALTPVTAPGAAFNFQDLLVDDGLAPAAS